MNELSKLTKPRGSTKKKTRVGRGQASGLGKTAGRGGKGQKARTGNMHFEGFEGGQTPLQRRLPKRGFTNIHREDFAEINVHSLEGFAAGTVLDLAALVEAGLLKDSKRKVKLLGGTLWDEPTAGIAAVTIHVHKASASARAKLEAAGGKVEFIVARA
jgi:large subunit ribosomal protein L15